MWKKIWAMWRLWPKWLVLQERVGRKWLRWKHGKTWLSYMCHSRGACNHSCSNYWTERYFLGYLCPAFVVLYLIKSSKYKHINLYFETVPSYPLECNKNASTRALCKKPENCPQVANKKKGFNTYIFQIVISNVLLCLCVCTECL